MRNSLFLTLKRLKSTLTPCKISKTSTSQLVPELRLFLLTKNDPEWHAKHENNGSHLDPFWAIFWPGGQILTRFLLDCEGLVKGRRILDLGCGCGAQGMAAIKKGRSTIKVLQITAITLGEIAADIFASSAV